MSCLLILSIALEGCDTSSSPSNPVSAQPPHLETAASSPSQTGITSERVIVAFGDSLTAGLGVAPQENYPAQLEARLRAMGYPYRVVNAGISGDTTAGGLRRVDWIIKARPEIVILELGANDGLRGIPLQEIRSNLSQIIRRLQKEGVTVVLAGMKLPPNYGLQYSMGFSNLYEELAKEFDIPLIPFFLERVAARAELNQDDGIHPTGEGYHRVVENVLRVLLPLLKNQR